MDRNLNNRRILTLALEALKSEREKIEAEIFTIQESLRNSFRGSATDVSPSDNRISAAGRKSISDAMKKRWAKHRAAKALRKR